MKISATITIILGTIATILLFMAAVTTESGTIGGARSAGYALLHFFVVIIAFPFLIKASKSRSKFFTWYIGSLSVFNMILMLVASNAIDDATIYYVASQLEYLPLVLFYFISPEPGEGSL